MIQEQAAYGFRIRGGAGLLASGEWVAVVHIWNDPAGQGEPDRQFGSDTRFTDEPSALYYYITVVRPMVMELAKAARREGVDVTIIHLLETSDVIT